MSNVGALLKGRGLDVADGVYLERADNREPILEEYLRALAAQFPRLKSRAKRLREFVASANAIEPEMKAKDDASLVVAFKTVCLEMQRKGFHDELTARAFAAIREASRRTLGMRHYDVQLLGGWALLQGMIAEMATGEGKTLVATLAACTAAGSGATVHVITVNDYLSSRDAKTNEPIYAFFGLEVGIIEQGMQPDQRRVQYAKDIVYVSNKEIVFDYLKDRIATGGALGVHHTLRRLYRGTQTTPLLLRGLHVAIVDEADSVLIDEARTPLIISETQPEEHGAEFYQTALDLASQLHRGDHYEINAQRETWLTPKGEELLRDLTANLGGLWSSAVWRRGLIEKGLSALYSFHRDQHYIVVEDKVQIVDEFTGRVMPDRSWESGLHQMIEAKEGVEITGQRKTLSRMTYQRFFRRYLLLAGMTGTAAEIAPELRRVYDLQVMRIPTNLPSRRQRLPNQCWLTSEERWEAVANRAAQLSRDGRAVLIGTRSVEASEQLGSLLAQRGTAHTVLNARQDKEEADIVAQAGQPGRITVATNMAGRGTDIKLAEEVSKNGGLHVILTEFHESARVDRQLFGRCARQGEPGTVDAIVCLQDELFRRYAAMLSKLATNSAMRHGKISPLLLHALVRLAQALAERHNRGIRMSTLKQDRKLQQMLGFSGTPN
jgi:preprotein translocase subunit SecA